MGICARLCWRRGVVVAVAAMAAASVRGGFGQVIIDTGREQARIRIFASGSIARLGYALAAGDLNGDGQSDLVIGAPGQRADQRFGPGAVFVFFGPVNSGVIDLAEETPDVTITAVDSVGGLGRSLATGDVNGDGVDDLVIGAPEKAGQFRQESGVVYVFFGRRQWPTLLDLGPSKADVEIWGATFFENLGTAVAVGNIDGQGPMDLILSAPRASGTAGAVSGRVYVVLGGPNLQGTIDLKVTPAALTVSGRQAQGRFGWSLASADFNSDLFDDVAIGAYKVNVDFKPHAGEAYVVTGGARLPDSLDLARKNPSVVLLGAGRRDHFGFSLATGDLNGDGVSDLVAGARQASWPSGPNERGAVFAFWGRAELPEVVDLQDSAADFTGVGEARSGQFGYSVAVADIDQDGKVDLLVGAPAADPRGRQNAGEVMILGAVGAGNWDLLAKPASVIYLGPEAGAEMGKSVLVSDLDNNGVSDLVLGAPGAGGGEVFVFAADQTVQVEERGKQSGPRRFRLSPAYPNPFNGSTLLQFEVDGSARGVELAVYDRLGRRLRRLTPRPAGEGRFVARWDGIDDAGNPVASGVYFARLVRASRVATTKLVLIR